MHKKLWVLQRNEEYPSCTVEPFYIVEYGVDPAGWVSSADEQSPWL